MALRGDRVEFFTDISFNMSEVASRGVIVIQSTGGSGAAMDDALNVAKLPAVQNADVQSGVALGLLLNDVVNIDQTRQHLNQHKDETMVNTKCTLLRKGTVVTDSISGSITAGEKAYYTLTGKLIGAATYANLSADKQSAQVGRFLTNKDTDGFAKVEINIV